MEANATYWVRLRSPDLPGALGRVASRFGALKGTVVGVEILDRAGGISIHELVVSLPACVPVELIVREVGADEGVEVEDIQIWEYLTHDPQLAVLESASAVLRAETRMEWALLLAESACAVLRSSWAFVVAQPSVVGQRSGVLAAWGELPNARWLNKFIAEKSFFDSDNSGSVPGTAIAWVQLPSASAALVVGRNSVLRVRERQRLAALSGIADAWFHRIESRSYEVA